MALHLEEISLAVAPGAHALVLLDQAGWHVSTKLPIPDNITLLPLPPKSPELNPVENIWQFMRDNWLSNRIFKSYEDVLDHCCFAWNKLIDMPWKTISIGTRDDQRDVVLDAASELSLRRHIARKPRQDDFSSNRHLAPISLFCRVPGRQTGSHFGSTRSRLPDRDPAAGNEARSYQGVWHHARCA